MIMGFAYEYTYQDREHIIRTMDTMHAQLVNNPIIIIPAPGCIQYCTQLL